jgi:subtilisin family serine protease
MASSLVLGLSLALAAPALAADLHPTNSYLLRTNGAADLAAQVSAAGGTLVYQFPEIGYAAATSNDPGFAARLKQNSSAVQAVDQDMEVQWVPSAQQANLQTVGSSASQSSLAPASAFFYACQWNLKQIDAPGAWAKGYLGSPGVKVAVLDTGTDPSHVDLQGKIDVPNSISALTPGTSPCGAFDTNTIFDLNFHGTFLSGLITSNNSGMAGVAPNTQVVAVKVLNCSGSGRFTDVIRGILYASSLPDVDVINMSLTAGVPKQSTAAGILNSALAKAVNYAGSQGKLVVSASGNAGVDMDHDANLAWLPAQSGSGLGIYATSITDGLALYSNHGTSGTWVGAPGGDFPNTAAPLPGCPINPALQGLMLSTCSSFVCGANNLYVVGDGTSFATPTVAGVAALVDAKHGGALDAAQLKAILSQTADDLGATGTDNLFSHGRVNANHAVDQ